MSVQKNFQNFPDIGDTLEPRPEVDLHVLSVPVGVVLLGAGGDDVVKGGERRRDD